VADVTCVLLQQVEQDQPRPGGSRARQAEADRDRRVPAHDIAAPPAAGDCTTKFQFTHVGDEQGRLAGSNAFASSRLLPGVAGGAAKFDDSVIPWVTLSSTPRSEAWA